MNLTKLEKAAVISTAAAAAFKVLLWSVGATLSSDEWWLPRAMWLFGALSFVAFDLTLMAVVADQRSHGRGGWGTITLIAAAGFAALIALHVAEVAAMPALHAGPAILLLFFGLHLSSKRGAAAPIAAAPAPPAADDAAVSPVMPQLPAPEPQLTLPSTVGEFIRAASSATPGASHRELAARLGTSADTVRRALSAD